MLWGLWVYRLCTGQVRESLAWAARLLNQAERSDSEDMRLAALCASGGLATTSLESSHGRSRTPTSSSRATTPVHDRQLRGPAEPRSQDRPPGRTQGKLRNGCSVIRIGPPGPSRTACEHARRRRHPFDLHWALHFLRNAAAQHSGASRSVAANAGRVRAPGSGPRRCSLRSDCSPDRPRDMVAAAAVGRGRPKPNSGEQWPLVGTRSWPALQSPLLQDPACAKPGSHRPPRRRRRRLLEEALEQIERPGWEERFSLAEVLRTKGWILGLKGDMDRRGTRATAAPWIGRASSRRSPGSCARPPAMRS